MPNQPKPAPPAAATAAAVNAMPPTADADDDLLTYTQAEMTRMMTAEKRQGGAAALRRFAAEVGVDPEVLTPELVRDAIAASRAAEDAATRAAREAEEKVAAAARVEATAKDAIAHAERSMALVSAGVAPVNVEDAVVLLGRDLTDGVTMEDAVKALQERRPELFVIPAASTSGTRAETNTGAQRPARQQQKNPLPGDAGRARAARRFGTTSTTGTA